MNGPSQPQLDLTSEDRAAMRRLDSPGEPSDVAISPYGLPYFRDCAAIAKAVLRNCGKEIGQGCCGGCPCNCKPTPQTPLLEAPAQD